MEVVVIDMADLLRARYEELKAEMHRALRLWLDNGQPPPRFALPPADVGLVATLDEVRSIIVRNDIAEAYVTICNELAVKVARGFVPTPLPTVIMLEGCLTECSVEIERISLDAFPGYRVVPLA